MSGKRRHLKFDFETKEGLRIVTPFVNDGSDEHMEIAKKARSLTYGLNYGMTESQLLSLTASWNTTHKNYGAYRATDKLSVYPTTERLTKYLGNDTHSIYARAEEITRAEAKSKMYWFLYSSAAVKDIYTILESAILRKAIRHRLIVTRADLNEINYRYLWRLYYER